MKNIKGEKGQTIIEAIVALAAIFIIVTAITIAIISAVSNSQFIKNQNLANKYAQQGMEMVRSIQADNLDVFSDYVGVYSLPDGGVGLQQGNSQIVNVGGTHIRNIIIENDASPCPDNVTSINLKKVTVIVNWSSGKCSSDDRFCHDTTLVSCIPYERDARVNP